MIVRSRRRLQHGLTALAATSALFIGGVALADVARAAAPTFEPDSNSAGSVALYDAAGAPLTSGSTTAHPFATYYAASGGAIAGTNGGAQAYAATPQDGVNSNNWSNDSLSASTQFGSSASANYPGPLKNSPNAIAKANTGDFSLDDYVGEYPAASTANPNVYQIRVYTGSPTKYYTMDVKVTGSTWTQVYPAVASASPTTTTLGANPASPSTVGTSVTFTASVSPSVAGTVQFKDGTTDLGTPVAVSNGTATYSTSTLTAGAHSVTATFAPTDTAAYTGSTSSATTYTVNAAAATATSTSLTVSPTGPVEAGTVETLTATVTPPAAAGTVQFKDGTTDLGAPVTVSSGTATSTTTLPVGSHSLTAVFTPTDSAAYAASTSTALAYTVNAKPVVSTSTALTVNKTSPVAAGTLETLTATITPSAAAGTVTFKDGTTTLGSPATVDNTDGTAEANVTLASGTHSLTAEFTPADVTSYATSTSTAVPFTVNDPARPTTTSVTATPASPQQASTSLTFTATLTPNTATGTVQFKDGTDNLGTPVTLVNGSAQYTTTTLAKGSHQITAAFTPADSEVFNASSSNALNFVVADFPGTPPSIVATPVNQTATVTWAAPSDNGGTPITGYDLQQSTDGVTWTSAAPGGTRVSTATSKVVTGLTNGTGYFFRVAPINGIAAGAYTSTTTKATPVADATAVAIAATRSVRYAGRATVALTLTDARDGSRVGGVAVSLYRRSAGQAGYGLLANVVTSASGTASTVVVMATNSQFQWRFAGNAAHNAAASGVAPVSVVSTVSISAKPTRIKHGKTSKIYGVAYPAPAGQRVSLQRLLKGKWVSQGTTTVRRQKLPNGRTLTGYVFARKLTKKGTYTFRVTSSATGYALAGASGRITVRAT